MSPCHITCNVSTEITNITCIEMSEEKYVHLSFLSSSLNVLYLRYTETEFRVAFSLNTFVREEATLVLSKVHYYAIHFV